MKGMLHCILERAPGCHIINKLMGSWGKQRDQRRTITLIQVRAEGSSTKKSKKWSDSGYILKQSCRIS